MSSANSAKGNPATHRMGNAKLKARRQASWQRCQERKVFNRKANEERAEANRFRRTLGLMTPHETKAAKRRERRAAEHASRPCHRKKTQSCFWCGRYPTHEQQRSVADTLRKMAGKEE